MHNLDYKDLPILHTLNFRRGKDENTNLLRRKLMIVRFGSLLLNAKASDGFCHLSCQDYVSMC